MLKILNCVIIKETEKLKETMVGPQVELGGWPPISIWIIYGNGDFFGRGLGSLDFQKVTQENINGLTVILGRNLLAKDYSHVAG